MRWLLNQNKEYKLTYILTNVVLIFFDSIGILIPIVIGFIVDRVTVQGNYDHLLLITLGLIIFAIFKVLGSYFTFIKLRMTVEKIISGMIQKCYENLNKLDYYFFEHNSKGELMTNFTSDMRNVRRQLDNNIKNIGSIVITFIFSLGYLMTINTPFTIILLTPGVLVGVTSYVFFKKIKKDYDILRDKESDANDFVSDNIDANRVVKTFAIEKFEIKQMSKKNADYMNKEIEVIGKENTFYAKVDFLSYIMSFLFLVIGGYLFINDRISMGELIIFNSYLYNLRSPFVNISGLLNGIQRYKIGLDKIKKLMEAKPKIVFNNKENVDSLLVPIEFKNVRIVYDNKVVLEDLNLKIKPYETIAFIGKTGSGKSSIANLLLGFIIPESGEILINGKNYLDYDMMQIRQKVGYVTQSSFLFSDTIYNNIRYGNYNISKKEAEEYARIACCDYVERLSDGIDTVIGEFGARLSGGEKQRLSLARALAVKPDILLLDDITSALDIDTERRINESINELSYKSTKIIIASKIISVMNADRIYVLDNGKVIESGTHKELLANKGYYYDLYEIQKGDI